MRNEYVVIDFETTGLNVFSSEVVEIGALKFKSGKLVEQFELLLKPGCAVEEEALAIHKLSDAHLAKHGKAPQFGWAKLHEFIGGLPLIAHNGLDFDFQFIFNAFSQFNLCHGRNALIDTLPLAQELLKTKTGKFNQNDICAAYSIKNAKSHRAMGDVSALVDILEIMFEKTSDLEKMWESCGRIELSDFLKLPPELKGIEKALAESLDVQIDYQGKDKPQSKRWIKPLYVKMNRGKRYIVSTCLQENIEKDFLISRVLGVLGTRKSG